MDLKKIGAFIAACRKRHKLTQLELAEELGVTDRSVSNWENYLTKLLYDKPSR